MTEPEFPDPRDYCWPIDPGCLCEDWDDYPAELKARAISLATATLYRLTLGQVGGCPVTVRPCPPMPAYGGYDTILGVFTSGRWMQPVQTSSGSWVNCLCGRSNCGCTTGCEIVLPGKVGRVDEVKVGDTALEDTDYALLYHHGQYRVVWRGDGDCPFPKTQDLSKALGEEGTFSVTYLPADEPDGVAAWAAGTLANEFAQSCNGGDCRLPNNVVTLIRQGVTQQLVTGAFPNGRTGIREVDAWIALYNPDGKRRMSAIWSPDMEQVAYE